MRKKRLHVIVVREDGKLYHNRVLEWFQVKKGVAIFGAIASGLSLGTFAFFCMVMWHGNLVARNAELKLEEAQLKASLLTLGKGLEETRIKLSQNQKQLAGMEELARQQNLKVHQPVGLGGPVSGAAPVPEATVPVSDPDIQNIAARISELKAQTDEVTKETQSVTKVLKPHLEQLSHIPSVWPVKGFINSGFGARRDPLAGETSEFHEGLDISAPYGSPIQAPAEGLVIFCGWKSGYGQTIEISHGAGLVTRYGHLSKILVHPGQSVKRWQRIGNVGVSGRSTGSHLHYEIRQDDRAINPRKYLLF